MRKKKKRKNGRRSSAWIRPELRWAIYMRDSFTCAWCGACCGDTLTLDHVFVRGSPWRDNKPCRLVTCCFSCNGARKHIRLSEWLRILKSAGKLQIAMSALRRRHREVRRDVGAWAKRAFTGRGSGGKAGPDPYFVGGDGIPW